MNNPFSFKDKGEAIATPILDQQPFQNIDEQN
jgi:hypothetical protein